MNTTEQEMSEPFSVVHLVARIRPFARAKLNASATASKPVTPSTGDAGPITLDRLYSAPVLAANDCQDHVDLLCAKACVPDSSALIFFEGFTEPSVDDNAPESSFTVADYKESVKGVIARRQPLIGKVYEHEGGDPDRCVFKFVVGVDSSLVPTPASASHLPSLANSRGNSRGNSSADSGRAADSAAAESKDQFSKAKSEILDHAVKMYMPVHCNEHPERAGFYILRREKPTVLNGKELPGFDVKAMEACIGKVLVEQDHFRQNGHHNMSCDTAKDTAQRLSKKLSTDNGTYVSMTDKNKKMRHDQGAAQRASWPKHDASGQPLTPYTAQQQQHLDVYKAGSTAFLAAGADGKTADRMIGVKSKRNHKETGGGSDDDDVLGDDVDKGQSQLLVKEGQLRLQGGKKTAASAASAAARAVARAAKSHQLPPLAAPAGGRASSRPKRSEGTN